jgi:hypothetical protein
LGQCDTTISCSKTVNMEILISSWLASIAIEENMRRESVLGKKSNFSKILWRYSFQRTAWSIPLPSYRAPLGR